MVILMLISTCIWNDPGLSLEFDNLNGEWLYDADASPKIEFIEPGYVNMNVYDLFRYEISGNRSDFPKKHGIIMGDEGGLLRISNHDKLPLFFKKRNIFVKLILSIFSVILETLVLQLLLHS